MLGRVLGGAINLLVDAFEFLQENAALVKTSLLAIGGFFLIQAIGSVVTGIWAMVSGLTAATAGAIAFQVAIFAGIAIVVLLVQSFIVFMEGGDSIIGRFVERFEGDDGLLGAFARFLRLIQTDGPAAWAQITSGFGRALDVILGGARAIGGAFQAVFDFVGRGVDFLIDQVETLQVAMEDTRAGELEEEILAIDRRIDFARVQMDRLGIPAQDRVEAQRAIFVERQRLVDQSDAIYARARAMEAGSRRNFGETLDLSAFASTTVAPVAGGAGGGNTQIEVGGIEVNVTEPGATAPEIGEAVGAELEGLREAERQTTEPPGGI
jgi:hypothetical protein